MRLTKDIINKRYAEYDVRIIEFLNSIFEDVKSEHPKINNYFFVTFDLLANQLKLYFLALDAINEDSKLSSEDAYKRTAKNPCVAILNHAHQEILKILDDYGLSPFASAKIKRLSKGDEGETTEELINNLIN